MRAHPRVRGADVEGLQVNPDIDGSSPRVRSQQAFKSLADSHERLSGAGPRWGRSLLTCAHPAILFLCLLAVTGSAE